MSGVLLSILVFSAAFAAAQGQWEVVIPKSIEGVKVRMAAFHNEKFGVWGGAGDEGAQHYTNDGGKTWTKADTGGCMFSVDIVDANIIWQSCLSGTSLTTDGGKNWKEEAVPAKPGKPFISRDGKFLTVSKWQEGLTLLKAK